MKECREKRGLPWGRAFAPLVVFNFAFLLSPFALAAEPPVTVTIAAISDFHGHLQTPPERIALPDGGSAQAGGVTRLATAVQRLRAKGPHFALVSAGDLVGATPLLSALFSDEPVIEAMNLMGLDYNGIGNHEFDYGVEHLMRLQNGGCPESGCRAGRAYEGARFPTLAANVIVRATGKPLLAPYGIREFDGIKVGFIGLTLRTTPLIVTHPSLKTLEFRDEAETVNALVPELQRQGAGAIVVLIHQGGFNRGGYNECREFSGPIVNLAQRMDRAVDVIVSAHTHQPYICDVEGRLVTSAGAYGRLVTEITIGFDRVSRRVVSVTATNHAVTQDLSEDSAQMDLVARYAALAAPLMRVVGRVTAPFTRRISPDGESLMGKLIADAHLEATKEAGAVVAFMNPGGVRAPFEQGGDGSVNFADVYAVYPFNNALVTMTLTGAQIVRLLEQQLERGAATVIQVSKGFHFSWDPRLPAGQRVVPGSVTLHGKPVDAEASYRITVNSFMAAGGDGLNVLREGRDVVRGIDGREALERYVARHSPLAPVPDRRARNVGGD